MESFGRLSDLMEADLLVLARFADEEARNRSEAGGRWLRRWRSRLSHLLARLGASSVEACLGTGKGQPVSLVDVCIGACGPVDAGFGFCGLPGSPGPSSPTLRPPSAV